MAIKTLEWKKGRLYLLDQTRLPRLESYVLCSTHRQVALAIRNMIVRGAPAIGVAAAFGMVLGARRQGDGRDGKAFLRRMEKIALALLSTRPTAVNLRWSVERMKRLAEQYVEGGSRNPWREMEKEAERILREDVDSNRAMGRYGQVLIPQVCSILTHCNAGALATAGFGTALGVIRAARDAGKRVHVFVDETRPFLQGARLTAWELMEEQIPCTLITDNMAGWLMAQGKIDLAIVGADRIAANGDVANKIGTYSLAVLCRAHGIPFYVAAPLSTIDLATPTGKEIPIEQRPFTEVIAFQGRPVAPKGMAALNPAFDVTPHSFVKAIITEKGIAQRPFKFHLKKFFRSALPVKGSLSNLTRRKR